MTPTQDRGSGAQRLHKVLAHAGLGSRRAVEEMIAAGRIAVNGRRARVGERVDPTKDEVEVDGSPFPLSTELVYYLLNKPLGVVTSAHDPKGRATVLDLVDVERRVWPVGRLDADSEGALVVTNDGDLTHRLTHPSFSSAKTYVAEVEGTVGRAALRALRTGVDLEEGPTRPAGVEILDTTPAGTLLRFVLTEGRNRQIRRMGAAVGHPVRRLVRTAIGPLELGRLKPGTFRRLSPRETGELYRACEGR